MACVADDTPVVGGIQTFIGPIFQSESLFRHGEHLGYYGSESLLEVWHTVRGSRSCQAEENKPPAMHCGLPLRKLWGKP
jgi:hypothetical protein